MKLKLLQISNPVVYVYIKTPVTRSMTFFFEKSIKEGDNLIFNLQDGQDYYIRFDNLDFAIGGFVRSFNIVVRGDKLKSEIPYILLGYETCE